MNDRDICEECIKLNVCKFHGLNPSICDKFIGCPPMPTVKATPESAESSTIKPETWETFRKTGLLWWVNTLLHTFGWAITYEYNGDRLLNVYPARVEFRGFSEKTNTEGYIKISKYLKENVKALEEEALKGDNR